MSIEFRNKLEVNTINFNFDNKEKVKDLYIHDSEYVGFSYDYDQRKVFLSCDNAYLKKIFHLEFNNVILCNMQSCEFWGGGNSVYAIYLKQPCPPFEELEEIQNQHKEFYAMSYLDMGINYLSIETKLNSGDALLVVCESFDFTEEVYEEAIVKF